MKVMVWNPDNGDYLYVDDVIGLVDDLMKWAEDTSHYRCGYEIRKIIDEHTG